MLKFKDGDLKVCRVADWHRAQLNDRTALRRMRMV